MSVPVEQLEMCNFDPKKDDKKYFSHLFHHLLSKHPNCPVGVLHKEIESNRDEAGDGFW